MYKTHFAKRGCVHLTKQLKVNQLLDDDETNEEIMHNALQQIIPLFDIKSILLLITSNAKKEKLGPIFDIIAKQKRKYKDEQISKMQQNQQQQQPEHSDDDKEEQQNKKRSPFSLLSNESISHICDYLGQYDVKKCKLTSRQIGIICLEQMNKTRVGIFNMNSLIHKENKNECVSLQEMEHSMIWNRYPSNKKYSYLSEEWERQYNISESHQLIFSNIGRKNRGMASAKLINSHILSTQTIKHDAYFILDKKNVIFLNNNTQKKLIQCNDIQLNERYKVLILEYFDVLNQRISTKQFILYDGDISYERISNYIQNEFIPIDGICNKWYQELKNNLNLMSGDEQKLMFYRHGPHGGISWISLRHYSHSIGFMRVTFQLNIKHKWFKNAYTNKLYQYKYMFHQKKVPFYYDTKAFYTNNTRSNVHILIEPENKKILKEYVKCYYDEDDDSLKYMLKIIDQEIKLKVKKSSYSDELKTKIAETFENIIDPKDIQLFRQQYDVIAHEYKWELVKWNDTISQYTELIKYKVTGFNIY